MSPLISAFGETKSRAAWSRDPRCMVKRSTLNTRLRLGWTVEAALTTPARFKADVARPVELVASAAPVERVEAPVAPAEAVGLWERFTHWVAFEVELSRAVTVLIIEFVVVYLMGVLTGRALTGGK